MTISPDWLVFVMVLAGCGGVKADPETPQFAAGCSSHRPSSEVARPPPGRVDSALPSTPSTDASPTAEANIDDAGTTTSSSGDNQPDATHGRPLPLLDPAQWLVDHGVPEGAASHSTNASACAEVSVGQPSEAGIACMQAGEVERGNELERVYRVLERRTITVVRSKKPVVVADVIETVEPLDKEEATQPDLVNLEMQLAADGRSFVVQDRGSDFDLGRGEHRPRVSCDDALLKRGSTRSSNVMEVRWDRFDRELVSRACSQRGRWVWKAGRFSLVRGAR